MIFSLYVAFQVKLLAVMSVSSSTALLLPSTESVRILSVRGVRPLVEIQNKVVENYSVKFSAENQT